MYHASKLDVFSVREYQEHIELAKPFDGLLGVLMMLCAEPYKALGQKHSAVIASRVVKSSTSTGTTQQKPNCCFSKQLGYSSCVTILPMLIQRVQYMYS